MFTKREIRIILFLGGVLFIGTALNLYGRLHESSELDPSVLLRQPGGFRDPGIPAVDYDSASGQDRKSTEDHRTESVSSSTKQAEKVNINTAGAPELIAIPGVGPVLAQRIIEYREQHGGFNSEKDLIKVKGIGPVNVKKIIPHIEFE